MAQATITLTITTPQGVTAAEALRLFTDQNGFNPSLGMTRQKYVNQILAGKVRQDINSRRRYEAASTAEASVPDDISVE